MNLSEGLEQCANLLAQENKWSQGAYARTETGFMTNPWSSKAYSFCSLGAINFTFSGHPEKQTEAKKLLRLVVNERHISQWNDAPERTQTEIIQAFQIAARLAKEQEESTS